MARMLRIEYPGAFYHVMARGKRRETVFHDDDDRKFFLATLAEVCGMTGWRVHAWVLMGNHYHLCVQTPEANLVDGMKWLQNTVTRRYNVRHRAWGRLFGDRYKAVVVDGEDSSYYGTLVDYIHLNPVRARLVRTRDGQSVLDYPWSSLAGGSALPPGRRPDWLAVADGLEMFGLPDSSAGRRRMVERLDLRAMEESHRTCGVPVPAKGVDMRRSHLRRGWYWGGQAFEEKLNALACSAVVGKDRGSRAYRRTPQHLAHGEQRARCLLEEGLAAAGLQAGGLGALPGSDVRKVAIATLIRRQTTVSQQWIADRLEMRSAANVSQQLRRYAKAGKGVKLPVGLKRYLTGAAQRAT